MAQASWRLKSVKAHSHLQHCLLAAALPSNLLTLIHAGAVSDSARPIRWDSLLTDAPYAPTSLAQLARMSTPEAAAAAAAGPSLPTYEGGGELCDEAAADRWREGSRWTSRWRSRRAANMAERERTVGSARAGASAAPSPPPPLPPRLHDGLPSSAHPGHTRASTPEASSRGVTSGRAGSASSLRRSVKHDEHVTSPHRAHHPGLLMSTPRVLRQRAHRGSTLLIGFQWSLGSAGARPAPAPQSAVSASTSPGDRASTCQPASQGTN
mmetsp:Transcript_25256/g.65981  ORF Transcript_25256/g.65981 Transcript_25256/m.65981 type:complete len:267 (-) Transcript_25256:713-1513(-)